MKIHISMRFLLVLLLFCIGGCGTDPDGKTTTNSENKRSAAKLPEQDSAEVYLNRGIDWYNKGKYDKAIEDYNQAIRLNPKFTEAYARRGTAWSVIGVYDYAIANYNQAIQLEPNNGFNYSRRANALERIGDLDKAIEDYTKAIQFSPRIGKIMAYRYRGGVWKKRGKILKAEADFLKALKLEAEHEEK